MSIWVSPIPWDQGMESKVCVRGTLACVTATSVVSQPPGGATSIRHPAWFRGWKDGGGQ